MSPYKACLLITKDSGKNFGMVRFQIDYTLNVRMGAFMKNEDTEIMENKFKVKILTILEISASGNFNSYCMTIEVEFIIIVQKNYAEKLVFIDIKGNTKKQQYMKQCA